MGLRQGKERREEKPCAHSEKRSGEKRPEEQDERFAVSGFRDFNLDEISRLRFEIIFYG